MYGADTWATTKWQERRLDVNEMRMLRWMCGVTEKDKITNKRVRGSAYVAPLTKKITDKRLNWYGHVKRREEGQVLRGIVDVPVPGKKWRGIQKTTRKTFCKTDLKSVVLKVDGVLDRTPWKRDIQNQSGDPI